jgi:hypothetical protein
MLRPLVSPSSNASAPCILTSFPVPRSAFRVPNSLHSSPFENTLHRLDHHQQIKKERHVLDVEQLVLKLLQLTLLRTSVIVVDLGLPAEARFHTDPETI